MFLVGKAPTQAQISIKLTAEEEESGDMSGAVGWLSAGISIQQMQ